MKNFFKTAIVAILEKEAELVLKKYKPKIVAVTGSVGKTSAKDAIYSVLKTTYFVRKSEKSFNSEIGVPLTILGCKNGWNNPFLWLQNIAYGLELILVKHDYPEWLVLEVGADKPGDIKRVAAYVKPDVTVLTRFAKVPVHVEFFDGRDAVIREKGHLASALKPTGTLILNADDADVMRFKETAKSKVLTFGLENPADVSASNQRVAYEDKDEVRKPAGYTFKVDYRGNSVPIMINAAIGRQQIYPVLAAVAVGSALNINLVKIGEGLLSHLPPRGRMNVIDGIKQSFVIDDTYNSSPVALYEALDAFDSIEASGRKIAVLGDMLELGKFSAEEHRSAGERISEAADMLVTVGVRAKGFAEGARAAKMDPTDIHEFEDSRKAGQWLQNVVGKGDIVLAKGSQSIRMERVVEEIMLKPELKKDLLVRQEEEWGKR
jgi:UDP-N-acetylmuramoyl-tripeptide--D-alanyl-D-alanine ligase